MRKTFGLPIKGFTEGIVKSIIYLVIKSLVRIIESVYVSVYESTWLFIFFLSKLYYLSNDLGVHIIDKFTTDPHLFV